MLVANDTYHYDIHMIRGDSKDYNLLDNWVRSLKVGTVTLSCEIGVREGLGSKIIMDGIRDRTSIYSHFGIDPYNNLKYQHYDNSLSYTADYTDDMRLQLEKDLSVYPEFKLFHMTDIQFMEKHFEYFNYEFVHFDGPHMTKDVINEAVYFARKSAANARFVFDDYKLFNMDLICKILSYYNFKVMDKGENKICLEKQTL